MQKFIHSPFKEQLLNSLFGSFFSIILGNHFFQRIFLFPSSVSIFYLTELAAAIAITNTATLAIKAKGVEWSTAVETTLACTVMVTSLEYEQQSTSKNIMSCIK